VYDETRMKRVRTFIGSLVDARLAPRRSMRVDPA
jgi:hypothetical protein